MTEALLRALLAVCSTADPFHARMIHTMTSERLPGLVDVPRKIEVPIALALAVAVEESGVKAKAKRRQHNNVMGLGPAALRVAGPQVNTRTRYALEMLEQLRVSTGSWKRALSVYHRGRTTHPEGSEYAYRVLQRAARIRRLARQEEAK